MVSRHAKWIFMALGVLGILTVLPTVTSWSDASRMATVQSLVDFHTFSIDRSVFHRTGDKVFIDGHFYSDKLAVPSLIGAIVYLPLSALGLKLGYGWNIAYYVITLLTVKAFWLAGLIAFYRTLAITPLTDRKRIWLTLALGVGSLYFTWSATFNNHSLAASWVAIGFSFLMRAREGIRTARSLFAAGLFFALAGGSDVPILAVLGGFLLYVLADPRLRTHAGWYLLPLPLTALPALWVNYRISGSLVPVQLVPAYFQYPGTPWKPTALTGAGMNRGAFLAEYAFHCLVGKRGFLLYNPLLFLAVPLLLRELATKRPFFREARVVCLVTVPIVAYYLLYSHNYSGWSYSIRWFVPLLPLLFFFLYPSLAGRLRIPFFIAFAAGTAIAVIGLINPWSWLDLSPYPLIANLRTIPHLP
ncbi:hypothetical protein [Actinoplanes sp. NPDC049681]|uniref:hypothetical protein n=1 Tax=Actinoplanes sp. NPDC049681 TaxID=3363905 RepID=UPI0037B553A8